MRCFDCGKADLVAEKKRHRYLESGLDNVVLDGVEVSTCPACATESVSIPRMTLFHRAIAQILTAKPGALLPAEIVFLRKSLGWSTDDFARFLHVDTATVKRWENKAKFQGMGPQAELLLRIAVSQDMKLEDYNLQRFQAFSFSRTQNNSLMLLRQNSDQWVPDAVA